MLDSCDEERCGTASCTLREPSKLTLDKLDVKAKRARYAGRPATASTAAGLMSKHLKELEALLEDALG